MRAAPLVYGNRVAGTCPTSPGLGGWSQDLETLDKIHAHVTENSMMERTVSLMSSPVPPSGPTQGTPDWAAS